MGPIRRIYSPGRRLVISGHIYFSHGQESKLGAGMLAAPRRRQCGGGDFLLTSSVIIGPQAASSLRSTYAATGSLLFAHARHPWTEGASTHPPERMNDVSFVLAVFLGQELRQQASRWQDTQRLKRHNTAGDLRARRYIIYIST